MCLKSDALGGSGGWVMDSLVRGLLNLPAHTGVLIYLCIHIGRFLNPYVLLDFLTYTYSDGGVVPRATSLHSTLRFKDEMFSSAPVRRGVIFVRSGTVDSRLQKGCGVSWTRV